MSRAAEASIAFRSYKLNWPCLLAVLVFVLVGAAMPAQAQATRTWVSGVGDDVNPCSRTAPCKTFAGAISKTATKGEINCLDSGGFGAVTITKSITILCEGTVGGVLGSNTNGIVVNAAASDIVVLRGLDIDGAGTGLNGIRFINGAALIVENVRIRNFNAASPNGWGIQFNPTSQAELYVTGSTIANNGNASDGGGIQVKGVAASTSRAMINRSNVQNNSFGIKADGAGLVSGVVSTIIRDSVSIGNSLSGIVAATPAGGPLVNMIIDRSAASFNQSGFGVLADGANSIIRMGGSTVAFNNNGVSTANSGAVFSYQDNYVNGNTTSDGTPITAVARN
jgi:hypothetical protein